MNNSNNNANNRQASQNQRTVMPDTMPSIGTLPGNVVPTPPIAPIPEVPDQGGNVTPYFPIGVLPQRPEPPFANENEEITVCLYQLSYIWDRTGESFWAYPTYIENNRLYGYRWNQRAGWFLYDLPLSRIRFIICAK